MSLLHLFKLPHNDAEQNHVPILLWLHDNILPVFLAHGWSRSLQVFFLNFVFGLHIDYELVCNMDKLKVKKSSRCNLLNKLSTKMGWLNAIEIPVRFCWDLF